jgi:hypothetical protein
MNVGDSEVGVWVVVRWGPTTRVRRVVVVVVVVVKEVWVVSRHPLLILMMLVSVKGYWLRRTLKLRAVSRSATNTDTTCKFTWSSFHT